MSTRPEGAVERQPAHAGKHPLAAGSQSERRPVDSGRYASAENPANGCLGAISLVEVTVRSLDSQNIAAPEQEVLKRALQALWSVHNWLYDRSWPEAAADSAGKQECRP